MTIVKNSFKLRFLTYILPVFLLGSCVILDESNDAGQDKWHKIPKQKPEHKPVLTGLNSSTDNCLPKDNKNIKIMSVNQVKKGMVGCGLTVYEGVEPEKFYFKVWGKKKMQLGATTSTYVILAKISGGSKKFPASKTGVVAGMSGSPMYINGKLVGALAFGFNIFEKDPICGIQPAEYMLNPQVGNHVKNLMSNNIQIPFALNIPASLAKFLDDDVLKKDNFKKYFLFKNKLVTNFVADFIDSSNASVSYSSLKLKPGSSLSVALVSGDISISGTGTVTMVKGDKIYAFGHPMVGNGKTAFPFHQNEILGINSSLYRSFKISGRNVGNQKGTIVADYHSGIFGRIGQKPNMLPLKIIASGPEGNKFVSLKVANSYFVTSLVVKPFLYALLRKVQNEVSDFSTAITSDIKTQFIFDNRNIIIQGTIISRPYQTFRSSLYRYCFYLYRVLQIIKEKNAFRNLKAINVIANFNKILSKNLLKKVKVSGISVKGKAIPGKKINVIVSTYFELGNVEGSRKIIFPVVIPKNIKVGTGNLYFRILRGINTIDTDDIKKMDLSETFDYLNRLLNNNIFLVMWYAVDDKVDKQKPSTSVRFGSFSSGFVTANKLKNYHKVIIKLPFEFDHNTVLVYVGGSSKSNVYKSEEAYKAKKQVLKKTNKLTKVKKKKADKKKEAHKKSKKKKDKK